MSFEKVQCEDCGGPVKGLQLTMEQRRKLDLLKNTVLLHMASMEEAGEDSTDHQGWLAISRGFLFLYGYMVSREDKVQ